MLTETYVIEIYWYNFYYFLLIVYGKLISVQLNELCEFLYNSKW